MGSVDCAGDHVMSDFGEEVVEQGSGVKQAGDGDQPAPAPASAPASGSGSGPEEVRTETLRMYYKWLFPHKDIYRWLSYGNDRKIPGSDQGESYFRRREFSLTLENDIYLRFQSFKDAAEMEEQILKKCPHKIDIGAVYTVDPKWKTALQGGQHFAPVERELVFDIDMTDYDDIRTCCVGATVCGRCWTLMTVAIKVIDRILRDDFGFRHILWVFSGRRGVHCWVCDSRARRLNDEQRTAITDYLRVYEGAESNTKKVNLGGGSLHPSLRKAYTETLERYFLTKILPEQRVLESESAWNKVLDYLPEEGSELKETLSDKWSRITSGEVNLARWKLLEPELIKAIRAAGKQKSGLTLRVLDEIVFGYTYPRIDVEVSKHMNHLLKAPFCIHPKTGKVCVPIDPASCEDFDPDQVPSLAQLLEELNQGGEHREQGKSGTSLDKHIEYFRSEFLNKLAPVCKAELGARLRTKLAEGDLAPRW